MKKYLLFSLLIVLTFACAKEEKLELFSPESFAYSLDSGWELNSSVRARGFLQKENNDRYIARLSYNVDLVTPNGDTLFNADYGMIDQENDEEIMDLAIETQMEFDSTFSKGKYILLYRVEDNLKPQSAFMADTVSVEE